MRVRRPRPGKRASGPKVVEPLTWTVHARQQSGRPVHGGKLPMAGTGVDLRERFLGCLLGCAVGDALGAPYEGLWAHSIPEEERLLAEFAEYEGYPRGQYTDDTQLSVATVESLLASDNLSCPHIARSIA